MTHEIDRNQASARDVVLILLRARRSLLRWATAAAVVIGVVVLLSPRWWRAEGSFIAQNTRLPGSLAALSGVASQFGIAIPNSDANYPPQFYVSLMRSRAILDDLVEYPIDDDSDQATPPQTLMDLVSNRRDTPEVRRERTRRWLSEEMLNAGADLKSGLISFSIRSRSPGVASALAQEVLSAVVRFNEGHRQSQAGAERRFTEQRLAEVRNELREAENKLARFLQRNRDYRNAPTLVFEFDRLSREVNLRQQIFTALSQAFEQARIEEVRDTPILTVVDEPSRPATPQPRRLLVKTILAFAAALGLGIVVVLSRAAWNPSRHGSSPASDDTSALMTDVASDLRHPWRLLLS